jgi:tetratricopeptide (TPR) repeat protein
MAARFRTGLRAVSLGLLAGALVAGLSIRASAEPKSRTEKSTAEQPAKPARIPKDRRNNLDFLFGALKAAPDADSAKAIEDRIWAVWLVSKSDTANLLMLRAKAAMEAEDLDLAIQLLDALIKIKPDYAEAWNRRATVYFMKKDYGRALADIRQVLAREPRHFGAMSGLGMILQEIGDDKHALEIFRRALAVHPYLPKIPELVKTLSEKVEGRDI